MQTQYLIAFQTRRLCNLREVDSKSCLCCYINMLPQKAQRGSEGSGAVFCEVLEKVLRGPHKARNELVATTNSFLRFAGGGIRARDLWV